MKSLDLTEYTDIFQREEIDDGNLHQLTKERLRRMGIPLRPALKFLGAIEASNHRESLSLTSQRSSRALRQSSRLSPGPGGEHRQVTVLYCDLVQSTELTHELGNERYAEIYTEYSSTCERIVGRYGQEITQRTGDGFGVCFGLNKAREDDAERAVQAAIELKQAVSKIPTTARSTARCRIGIGTGAVAVVGWEVFGDVMNQASRLQDLGAPGDIIIADSTRNICGDAFVFTDLGYRDLKGFGPQRVWQLGFAVPGISRFEATRGRNLSPLVGRKEELRKLREYWSRARKGEAQAVFIEGEAGIGKSRLVRELMDEVVAPHRYVILRYQCVLRRRNTSYHPVIEQLERESGIQPNQAVDEKLERLKRFMSAWGEPSESALVVFASLLGLESHATDDAPAVVDLSDQIAFEFAEQLRRISRKHPTLIVFEDVHWIDPSTSDLLKRVVPFIKEEALPVLMVLTHRPRHLNEDDHSIAPITALMTELRAEDGLWHYAVLEKLSALMRDDSFAIIQHVASGHTLERSLLESIASRADDVPLFVEEVTKYVLEFGELHELAEHEPVLLERIYPYLIGRLDALGNEAKEVAQVGSVIGRRFTPLLLSRGLGCQISSLEPKLDRLVRSELVYKRGDGPDAVYAFEHALVQDAAYASLFQSQKREYHYCIAEALEREFPDVAASEPDVLAWHFTEAQEYLRALDYWRNAGEAAIARSAMKEARYQFECGRDLVQKLTDKRSSLSESDRLKLDNSELDLLADLGVPVFPLEGSGDKELVVIFERVKGLCSKLGRPDREFDANLGLSNYYYVGGNFVEGERYIEKCLDLAKKTQDEDQLVSAYRIAGELTFYRGNFDTSIEHLRQSIDHYSIDRHSALLHKLGDDPGVLAQMYLAIGLWFKGEIREAFAQCEKGIATAERLGHEYTLGQATFNAAWLYAMARNHACAETFAVRSIDLCSSGRDEFRLYLGCSTVIHGWTMIFKGDAPEGVRTMENGMPLIEDTDAEICMSCFLPWLAEGLGQAGQIEGGLKVIEQAHKWATTEHFYDAERLRIEGELCTTIDRGRADRCLNEAIDLSRERGMKGLELRAALALNDFKLSKGEKPDPHEHFGHLRPWIEREAQGFDVCRARSLLKE